ANLPSASSFPRWPAPVFVSVFPFSSCCFGVFRTQFAAAVISAFVLLLRCVSHAVRGSGDFRFRHAASVCFARSLRQR
ncbi:hypothetical protein H1215_11600, partial [Anoxybacillus sp. LAT_38]